MTGQDCFGGKKSNYLTCRWNKTVDGLKRHSRTERAKKQKQEDGKPASLRKLIANSPFNIQFLCQL